MHIGERIDVSAYIIKVVYRTIVVVSLSMALPANRKRTSDPYHRSPAR